MSISFSGLASGMDTSSWVEALVSVKQAEITKLETKKSTILAAQDTLNSVKSYFSSFQNVLQNITDSQFGIASTDLFSQNLAESSNLSALTAVAANNCENTTYNIEVNKLATYTEVNSGIKIDVTTTVHDTATSASRLLDLGDDPVNNPLQTGDIVFTIDGFDRTIAVSDTTTINDFIDSLYSIGIDASYNETTGIFSMNAGVGALKSDATGVMANLHLSNVNYGYDTERIDVITTVTTPGTATIGSQLKHFGATQDSDCAFTVTKNDGTIIHVTTFTPDSTLEDVFDVLSSTFQINYEVADDGTITLVSDKFGNVFGGNLYDLMNFTVTEDPYVSLSKMTSTDIVYTTQETLVNRDATLGQIGAITNSNDKLIIKSCDGGNTVTTITSLTQASTVQDLFNVMAEHGITATINDGIISLNSTTGNYIDGSIATNMGILHPVTDTYFTTAPIVMTSSENINTAGTLGSLGMSSDGSVVIYSPVYGIVSVNIAKELTVQQFCDKINDSNYGIKAEISGSKVKISELAHSGAYVKGLSSVLQTALKLGAGEDLSYNTTTINVYSNTDSTYIKYDDTAVELNANSTISSINGYNHGNGQIKLHRNGEESIITVDKTLTIDEFINNPIIGLAQYDLTGNILSDGKAYLTADSDIWLEEIEGGSNILTKLNFSPLSQTISGQHGRSTSQLSSTVRVTTTVAATGSTELSSLNYRTIQNGTTETVRYTEGSLVFKVNDYYKTVHLDKDDTFDTMIAKMKDVGIDAYITRGSFYIASGYDTVEYIDDESTSNLMDIIKISGPKDLDGYSASSQAVMSKIVTTEKEKVSAANYAGNTTKLSDLGITTGALTIYRNGQRANIEIGENETFSSLQTQLNNAFGTHDLFIDFDANNNLRDGKLRIYAKNLDGTGTVNQDVKISIGSTSDKTNFVAITGISLNDNNQLESSRMLYRVNDKTAVCQSNLFRASDGSSTTVTEGSFKVGNAEIFVNSDTTMSDIVAQINTSENSLATAYWDNVDGKLVIRSTVTGASAVNIEKVDSNITDVLGLTNGVNLVLDAQTIGSNAVLTINGTKYTSLSNTVTAASTGITGLTINLKGLTNGSTTTLKVKRDTDTMINAVTNVLDGYNELMTNIDAAIAKDGKLKDQSMLRLVRNNIRTAMNSSVNTELRNLAAIGIKASDSNASNISVANADIINLSLDEEAFLKAYEADPNAVKELLIGVVNASGEFTTKGILTKVEDIVEGALTAGGGFFKVANDQYSRDTESVTKKILNGTLQIEKYRKRLENKFSSMDMMIAGMQNQFKSFLG